VVDDVAVSLVQVYLNGALYPTQQYPPWTTYLTIRNRGTYALEVRAFDAAGNAVVVGRTIIR
jgi:hypothetical protein